MPDLKPIPDGYPQVTPYLIVDGANEAIEFYSKVFGAQERMRMDGPDGKVGHAELQLGSGLIMLADPNPDMGIRDPKAIGGTPVTISLYVEDVDSVFGKAIEAGATASRPVEDQFYGDRSGQFEDPFGHKWSVASHVEDVPPEEMEKRAAEFAESQAGPAEGPGRTSRTAGLSPARVRKARGRLIAARTRARHGARWPASAGPIAAASAASPASGRTNIVTSRTRPSPSSFTSCSSSSSTRPIRALSCTKRTSSVPYSSTTYCSSWISSAVR